MISGEVAWTSLRQGLVSEKRALLERLKQAAEAWHLGSKQQGNWY